VCRRHWRFLLKFILFRGSGAPSFDRLLCGRRVHTSNRECIHVTPFGADLPSVENLEAFCWPRSALVIPHRSCDTKKERSHRVVSTPRGTLSLSSKRYCVFVVSAVDISPESLSWESYRAPSRIGFGTPSRILDSYGITHFRSHTVRTSTSYELTYAYQPISV